MSSLNILAILMLQFPISCKNNFTVNRDDNDRSEMYLSYQNSNVKSPIASCGILESQYYFVKKEVDGDTFWLQDSCECVKIRLIGIDAPESKNMFGKIKEEFFGKEANALMSSLLLDQRVRVEFDVDSLDQYGRTLAYCYTENGVFLNMKLIEMGLAVSMTVLPNVKYADKLYNAQVLARSKKLGIWKETE